MQRSPELEAMLAGDEVDVRDKRARRKQLTGRRLPSFWAERRWLCRRVCSRAAQAGERRRRRRVHHNDLPSTIVSSRWRESSPKRNLSRSSSCPIPPSRSRREEPSDTTKFDVPAPPGVVQRRSASHRSSLKRSRSFPKRFLSKQVVIDSTKGDNGRDTLGASSAEGGPTVAGEDRNSKFLAAASAIGDRQPKARQDRPHRCHDPGGNLDPRHP